MRPTGENNQTTDTVANTSKLQNLKLKLDIIGTEINKWKGKSRFFLFLCAVETDFLTLGYTEVSMM